VTSRTPLALRALVAVDDRHPMGLRMSGGSHSRRCSAGPGTVRRSAPIDEVFQETTRARALASGVGLIVSLFAVLQTKGLREA
jgi:hypothetical protein